MVQPWQLWLSPRPLRRTKTPVERRMMAPEDAALFEYIYQDDGRLVVKETHYADSLAVREGRSGPPLHIHIRQTEYFKVLQGRLAAVRNGKEVVLTKDDGLLEIPAGTRHRFWAHFPVTEDLIFEVWPMPQGLDPSFDEKFLRNYLGYIRDCEQQKIALSFFQMALLGSSGDTLLICPPFWVPLWILKLAQFVAGDIIGGLILGYQSNYSEYNPKH
ncbi:hypothetical protein BKA66DRAFT_463180 [Pyrenochaeta sp. MPI-SDFR-AT-0127]|nr:hypothetical protein BKA66DRAFT_463180 [Pyrenochaeta sp. MPI-SDFR-AT-0127]